MQGGATAFPQADAAWRGVFRPRGLASAIWESDLAQVSWWLSLQLSHKRQFLHRILIHVTFPLLEPRVSSCEWDFVCWSFKRAFVSLVDSSLSGAHGLCLFSQPSVMWVPLLSSGVVAGEAGLRLRPHASPGEPLKLRYPSGISPTHWQWGQPFSHLCSSYWSQCVFFPINF